MDEEQIKQPYIKPTRHIHDSGFRTFEVGYILEMKNNRVIKKQVLGEGSDHIYQDYLMMLPENKPFCLNIDLTVDGYIRLFTHGYSLKWQYETFCGSDMALEIGKKL